MKYLIQKLKRLFSRQSKKSENTTEDNQGTVSVTFVLNEEYDRFIDVDFDVNNPKTVRMFAMLFCFMDQGVLAGDIIEAIDIATRTKEGEISPITADVLEVFELVKEQYMKDGGGNTRLRSDVTTPFVDPMLVIQ